MPSDSWSLEHSAELPADLGHMLVSALITICSMRDNAQFGPDPLTGRVILKLRNSPCGAVSLFSCCPASPPPPSWWRLSQNTLLLFLEAVLSATATYNRMFSVIPIICSCSWQHGYKPNTGCGGAGCLLRAPRYYSIYQCALCLLCPSFQREGDIKHIGRRKKSSPSLTISPGGPRQTTPLPHHN